MKALRKARIGPLMSENRIVRFAIVDPGAYHPIIQGGGHEACRDHQGHSAG